MTILSWALSPNGQAVAAWGSNLLSLLAIVLALLVALVEQRRSHAEQAREAARERQYSQRQERESQERRDRFLNTCLEIIDEGISEATDALASIPPQTFIDWRVGFGIPKQIAPALDALQAVRTTWQDDPEVILAVSRAVISLDDLVNGQHDPAPSSAKAMGFLVPRIKELRQIRDQVAAHRHPINSSPESPPTPAPLGAGVSAD